MRVPISRRAAHVHLLADVGIHERGESESARILLPTTSHMETTKKREKNAPFLPRLDRSPALNRASFEVIKSRHQEIFT